MNMKNRYFLYARKSSESEERQVQSVEDQINFWKKRASELGGIEIVKVFTEEKSAKTPYNRPEFQKMITEIEQGGVDGILCWKLDRLTRNPVDTGTIQFMLQRGKIEKIVTSDREYHPGDSGLLFSVETGMANQFILDLSKNTKRGMAGKADRGGLC
jgi:site-specific DNA recombinase